MATCYYPTSRQDLFRASLAELDGKVNTALGHIDELIDRASKSWTSLRQARKDTCTVVNDSMHSFFVRLSSNALTEAIDQLLIDLRTGSFLHEASVQEMRRVLDRKAFLRSAIRYVQFDSLDDGGGQYEVSMDPRKIAHAAMDRGKHDGIAKLAVLWPGDGIEVLHKQKGSSPVPFGNLTEGLKALAIKEISFAASQLPAITDQPEDAVPTAAIFENLVPTLRSQRASRQFIVASHDANVVVSGDMERVVVFPSEASEQPNAGTLFDSSIRSSAVQLLEGGDRAFELRRRRYGEFG